MPASGSSQQYRRATRLKGLAVLLALFGLLLVFALDVASGPGGYSLQQVLNVLWEPGVHGPQLEIVVWDIRLPIALMALAVGAMLGAAGAQMQTILNNPLAEPFTLGIQSASAFGAALAIVVGVGALPIAENVMVSLSAFVFALLTTYLLYLFTRLRGATGETMVLIGIALLFTFNALLYLLQYIANDAQLMQIVFWMMGSLSRASWEKLAICGAVMLLVIPFFVRRSWALTALRLGDDRAAALGVNPNLLRIQVLVGVSMLAATAASFTGVIMFVGLVGPHIARMLVGEDQRFFLPMAMLCGALIMSATSLVSKSVTPGVIYPVGIVTSLIGIPFFISLILSVRRRSWV